ncbi:flippase-like domain-containing protein [Caproiciproducens sp. NJN-50]|uniref:lysylphosphatidylglycerol synthase transmembrane domain-containing protein n=1 Tax=Acutalibacteraceae TaxID=3082771 RepID=UPI000FFDFD9E|nr:MULTISPECIES: lysylphosphatidylglycerol synthase transmembrane domain-containing protein [Acutalibacteraceae]QAT48472.1 flippase-like domain-containing protein [Caproiciproducens sp. NJN-50]
MAEKKKKFGKNLFVAITLILSISILLYFLFTMGGGIETLARISKTLRRSWLLAAVLAAVSCWLLEGYEINLLCRHLKSGWRFSDSFSTGMIGFLYSAVTPFATGGQPMQMYTLSNMGMDTGMAGSVVAVKTLIYQVVMVLYALLMVALKLHYFQTSVTNFAFLTVIGLFTNCIFIAVVVLFIVSEKTTDRILRSSLSLLHRMKLCRHPEERYRKIHSQLQVFHDASKLMGNSAPLYLSVMVSTVLQITLNSLIPFFIYRSFNMHGASVTTMVAAQVFVAMVSAFVPLPGGSGGAESSFYLFFSLYFGATAIFPAILLWRIITYYANIVFGGVFAYLGSRMQRMKRFQ